MLNRKLESWDVAACRKNGVFFFNRGVVTFCSEAEFGGSLAVTPEEQRREAVQLRETGMREARARRAARQAASQRCREIEATLIGAGKRPRRDCGTVQ
jgi:hypothetical protein